MTESSSNQSDVQNVTTLDELQSKIKDLENKIHELTASSEQSLTWIDGELNAKIEALKTRVQQIVPPSSSSKTDKEKLEALEAKLTGFTPEAYPAFNLFEKEVTHRLDQIDRKIQAESSKGTDFETLKEDLKLFNARLSGIATSIRTEVQAQIAESKGWIEREVAEISKTQIGSDPKVQFKLEELDTRVQGLNSRLNQSIALIEGGLASRISEMTAKLSHWEVNAKETFAKLEMDFNLRFSRMEAQKTTASPEALIEIKAVEERLDRQVKALRGEVDQLSAKKGDFIAWVEGEIKGKLNLFKEQLDQAQQSAQQYSVSDQSFRNKLVTLKMAVETCETRLNDMAQTMDRRFQNQIDELKGGLQNINLKFHETLEPQFESGLRMLKNDFQDLSSQVHDSLTVFDRDSQLHLSRVKAQIEKLQQQSEASGFIAENLQAKLHGYEQMMKDFQQQANQGISTLEHQLNYRISESEKNVEKLNASWNGFAPVVEQMIRSSAAELENKFSALHSDIEGFKKQLELIRFADETRGASLAQIFQEKISHINRQHEQNSVLLKQDLDGQVRELKSQIVQLRGDIENSNQLLSREVDERIQDFNLRAGQTISGYQSDFQSKILELKSRLESLVVDTQSLTVDVREKAKVELDYLGSEVKRLNAQLFQDTSSLKEKIGFDIKILEAKLNQFDEEANDRLQLIESRIGKIVQDVQDQYQVREKDLKVLIQGFELEFKEKSDKNQTFFFEVEKGLGAKLDRLFEVVELMQHKSKDTVLNLEKGILSKLETLRTEKDQLGIEVKQSQELFKQDCFKRIDKAQLIFDGIKDQFKAEMDSSEKVFQIKVENLVTKVEQIEGFIKKAASVIEENVWKRQESFLQGQVKIVQEDAKKLVESHTHSVEKKIHSNFLKQGLMYGLLGVCLIGAFAFLAFQTEHLLRKGVKDHLKSSEFGPMVIALAKDEVPGVIERNARPVVDQMQAEAYQSLRKFDGFIDRSKKQYQDSYADFLRQLEILRTHNQIRFLEDQCINEGSRASYERLAEYAGDEDQIELAQAAGAAMARIKEYFRNMDYQLLVQEMPNPSNLLAKEPVDTRSADELIAVINLKSDWHTRLKAAQLLGAWNGPGVPDALIKVAKTDPNLFVMAASMKSFSQLTGYKNSDVFSFDKAESWWQTRRK